MLYQNYVKTNQFVNPLLLKMLTVQIWQKGCLMKMYTHLLCAFRHLITLICDMIMGNESDVTAFSFVLQVGRGEKYLMFYNFSMF